MRGVFLAALFLLMPLQAALAAVSISEIAWMGTTVSANDEWIELHNNDGHTVSIDGWQLTDGANFAIILEGSLSAGTYGVLERTDDASAPGSALMVYTGSLSNAGATLSLYDASGALIDRVVGGENWERIGGDNATKETAQYSVTGWMTAPATPGSAPDSKTVVSDQEEEEEEEEQDEYEAQEEEVAKKNDTENRLQTLHHIPRKPQVAITGPHRVYENQQVSFTAHTAGIADGIAQSLQHAWNFGDLHTAHGEAVSHRFVYPGEYVVTLHSTYKTYEATARMTVVVLPVRFSLSRNSSGDIQIHNDAKYEIDISGHYLAGKASVRIPDGTVLLPGATITVPKERVAAALSTQVVLQDEGGTVLAYTQPEHVPQPPAPQQVVAGERTMTHAATPVATTPTSPESASQFGFVSDARATAQEHAAETETQASSTQTAAVVEALPSVPKQSWPYMALFGVMGMGVLAVFAGHIKQ